MKKPRNATNQVIIFRLLAISIAGDNNDQNDAAIITPAAKPSIASITLLFIFLKKKTNPAPKAVIPQVKIVAKRAWMV